MAQLWGGRFTKETDQLVYNFNASISFDQKFYKQDIEGSMAHVCMLHTGRSRNDQVALDMRLYTRLELLYTDVLLKELLKVLLRIMEEHVDTIMPGFTHLQKAQPVTLAHHMGAYF